MEPPSYSREKLREVLERTRTIAVVGVSANEVRPSYYTARYLDLKGYRVIPINPRHAGRSVFGKTILPSLRDIPPARDPIQMVEIFRRSEEAGAVVDEALDVLIDRGLETIWMQIGVIDHAAAARAEARGLTVVMNRCPKIEYQRMFGELRMGGFNTGIVSSRLG